MKVLDKYLDFLNESYTSTISKRTRQQKIKSSAGAIGVSLVRQKNDPLYKKMMLHKQKYIQTKKQLQKKYKSKANMLARKRANEFKP